MRNYYYFWNEIYKKEGVRHSSLRCLALPHSRLSRYSSNDPKGDREGNLASPRHPLPDPHKFRCPLALHTHGDLANVGCIFPNEDRLGVIEEY